MNKTTKQILQFLFFASIGATILYLLYQSNSEKYLVQCVAEGNAPEDCVLLDKIWNDFLNSKMSWLILVLVIYLLSNLFRTWRWLMLLKPLGYKPRYINAFMAVMLSYFANLGIPRLGEVLRATALAKYDNVDIEKGMGTIVTDRIMDVVSLFVVILIAICLEYDTLMTFISEKMNSGGEGSSAKILLFLFMLGVFGLIALYIIIKHTSFLDTKFGKKILKLVLGFKDGLLSIFSLERPWLFIGHTVGIWICYYLMTYLAFFAYEPTAHLGPSEGLIAFIFGTLGIVFPSPGGMGSYHLFIQEALTIYGIDSADGFSFANILYFVIQLFCNVVFGLLSLLLLPLINKK